jgi:hypothetical protein
MDSSLRQLRRSASLRASRWIGLCVALTGCLGLLCPPVLSAATFTASLDRSVVAVGGSVTLTLKFEGGSPDQLPMPPAVPNLLVNYTGGPMHIDININGQSSSIDSFNFNVTPIQPGDYVIPPMHVEVNGQTLVSQPLKLTALKPGNAGAQPGADTLAFWKLTVPKKEIYVGEVIQPQLQLYIRSGIYNAEEILQRFDQVAPSLLKTEGFNVIKTGAAPHQELQLENGRYVLTTLAASLSPVKSGTLSISLADARVGLQVPSRQNDGMDPLGFFRHYQDRSVNLLPLDEKVTVLPLPPGAPPGFNGAVGSYTLSVTAGPTNVAVGDPITVKVQISGAGNLDTLTLPEQAAWHDLKVYPPTPRLDSSDPLGTSGTKTFETVVIPQNTDLHALPPVSFSYFNTDKRSYETLSGPTIALDVRPGGSTAVPAIASARAKTDSAAATRDIVSIKQRLGVTGQVSPPLVTQPWFLGIQSLPVLAFVSAVTWRKRGQTLANNPRLQRRRRLAALLRQGLRDLQIAAGENNSEHFFAVLVRLLQEQIGERLDMPASAITEAVLEEHLRPRGFPNAALAELHDLFQISNQVRYAPFKSSQELQAFIPKFQGVLRELQAWKA